MGRITGEPRDAGGGCSGARVLRLPQVAVSRLPLLIFIDFLLSFTFFIFHFSYSFHFHFPFHLSAGEFSCIRLFIKPSPPC